MLSFPKADLVAGISVAGLLLPEAVAYAAIAGLPPQRAIFATIAGCLTYALIGRSRYSIVSPTSSAAAILAATLATVHGTMSDKAALATIITALIGIVFVFAALLRLGGLVGFISRPVLHGFAFGLAITIIIRQLPVMTGITVEAPHILLLLGRLFAAYSHWNLTSMAVGLVSLFVLLLLRRFPAIPGPFLVLAAGIAASYLLQLGERGVALVGPIGLVPELPSFSMQQLPDALRVAPYAIPLVLILFAESWGTIRPLALRNHEKTDANRELGALGITNLASTVVQGMPIGAGFSAGQAAEAAHARTRATGIVAGIGLAILIAFADNLVAHLPNPVLAAVVISALIHSVNPAPLIRLWRLGRDQYIALAAAAGVLLFGVLDGMMAAIVLSLAAVIQRMSDPVVARLGRVGDSHNFVDVARHPEASEVPEIAIFRPIEPLFFANADRMLNKIAAEASEIGPIKAIVLSLEESSDFDSSALDSLLEFDNAMHAAGIRVQYARLHDRARDLLKAAGASDIVARSSFSVDDAVIAITHPAQGGGAATPPNAPHQAM